MAFKGLHNFTHSQPGTTGILLVNLGTPDEPTAAALRRYLAEFLWDPRVVEIPRPLWWLILNGIILRTRPAKSARNYASIWTDQGSPLLTLSLEQKAALEASFNDPETLVETKSLTKKAPLIEVGMRYGNPSISSALDKLCEKGARRILVLPLYPQYCGATTASTFDAIAKDFSTRRWLPEIRFINHYHDFSPYIEACCNAIEEHWRELGQSQKLVLSYHGVPRFYLDKGDPYFCECHKTSRLIAERLGLDNDRVITTFQSRFGKAEWLQPYTDKTLQQLPGQGVKSVDVFCPGFASDCLETLEEIAVENKGYFLSNGGEKFHYIAALNARPEHISALKQLLEINLQGWDSVIEDTTARSERAKAMGAAH